MLFHAAMWARGSGGARRLQLGLTLALMGGCGPSEQIVAREIVPQIVPPPSLPSGARGRVSVADGQLVSDLGTPLRGLLLNVDSGWTLGSFDLMQAIAETTGLNAVHVYLENWTQPTGELLSDADALVALTAQAGLYLVLGIGGGPSGDGHGGTGWFDIEKVRSFWSLYADRYKDSTHVSFEIQNTPEIVCNQPLQAATIDMEREAYSLIRSLAPDSHVILFSTYHLPQQPVLGDAIERVSDVVDWSNASVGMHVGTSCVPVAEFGALQETARATGANILITELSMDNWASDLTVLERHGVGWIHRRWLTGDTTLPTLMENTAGAGVSWCPDRGSFPVDSSECQER